MSGPFFITCATGAQGGAVARHLLSQGCKVHAITRDPSSASALALASQGVKIFKGDLANEEALRSGMTGCTGLFLNLPPNPLTAVEYTQNILSAAASTNTVKHIVVSTALSTDNPEKLACWDPQGMIAATIRPKQTIEELVRTSTFLEYYTIMRPGNFMANFLQPKILAAYPGLETTGIFRTSFQRDNVLPMIDHDDIGKFGAAAFLDPQQFHAQAIALASELMTVDEIMAGLSKATGKKIEAYYLSEEEYQAEAAKRSPASWQKALRDLVQFVDMDNLKAWGIKLNSFENFLQREKDVVVETYKQV